MKINQLHQPGNKLGLCFKFESQIIIIPSREKEKPSAMIRSLEVKHEKRFYARVLSDLSSFVLGSRFYARVLSALSSFLNVRPVFVC